MSELRDLLIEIGHALNDHEYWKKQYNHLGDRFNGLTQERDEWKTHAQHTEDRLARALNERDALKRERDALHVLVKDHDPLSVQSFLAMTAKEASARLQRDQAAELLREAIAGHPDGREHWQTCPACRFAYGEPLT